MDVAKKRIILSKTNRIGDVVVSLPVASILKEAAPDCYIIMLVSNYTQTLPQHFNAVDEVICWDSPETVKDPVAALKQINADIIIHLRAKKDITKAAKKAGIPLRIGATNRLYNFLYCNKFCRVNRTRHATLHDAQLDIKLILPLIKKQLPSTDQITKLLAFNHIKRPHNSALIDKNKFNIIIHPKCVTHAGKREWPLENFSNVISQLNPDQFKIFITGTEDDGKAVRKLLCEPFPNIADLTGKLSLDELIAFIQSADGLIAGSTGPLHIAAAMGINALGLFTPLIGHNPARWKPLGMKAEYLVSEKKNCYGCKKTQQCPCIKEIMPEQVINRIQAWRHEKSLSRLSV